MALAGGYQSGRRDRRSTRNWRPAETSANADILPDLPDLRARSRDLARNIPIATGALATTVTNVVGDGLTVQSTIDREALALSEEEAKAWQRQAEREFALWCDLADFTSALSFAEMQGLILRSVLESGDILVVRRFRQDGAEPFGTKLQLVEADRISNANRAPDTATQVAGVKFDADGVAIGWEVATRHPDDAGAFGSKRELQWTPVPAWDKATGRPLALHIFVRLRPDQARGVPWLAPVIEPLKTLGEYSEAEVRAAVISAMFTAFVTSEPRDGDDVPIIGATDSAAVSEPAKEIALEDAGAIVELEPGQKVDVANPGRPNPVFDAFTMAVLRQVGVALELPFELLVKHFTASYSASRAALEMAWQFFRRHRTWLARRLCQPVYEWAIEEAVARGRLSAPGFFDDPIKRRAWLKAQWIGPPRINLDPLKEANAHEVQLRNGTVSRAEIIVERGGDPDAVHDQLAAEKRQRTAAGLDAPAAAPPADQPADLQDQGDAQT
ncbi:MAG: phage portal protein [Rhodospirillaceae bacterium]